MCRIGITRKWEPSLGRINQASGLGKAWTNIWICRTPLLLSQGQIWTCPRGSSLACYCLSIVFPSGPWFLPQMFPSFLSRVASLSWAKSRYQACQPLGPMLPCCVKSLAWVRVSLGMVMERKGKKPHEKMHRHGKNSAFPSPFPTVILTESRDRIPLSPSLPSCALPSNFSSSVVLREISLPLPVLLCPSLTGWGEWHGNHGLAKLPSPFLRDATDEDSRVAGF